ncbi:polysaccharide deacetylase family protein [Roseovarius aquimarinus]|uniref:Chitooligosaccharide deacetylase n=1 Tax=Roseovarius aquimarinus TaxID=1229156 RepID=A0ABW7I677_9RHOB
MAHLVCITVDVDNTSAMLARGYDGRAMLSRGEFGVVGTSRLLKLFAKHEMKCTWFVPGQTLVSFPDSMAPVVADGHELAVHGWTHRQPIAMSEAEEEDELIRAGDEIAKFQGKRPIGYRAPSWEPSWATTRLLAANGFVYDSSLMADDYTPYYPREGDVHPVDGPLQRGLPGSVLEIPVSPTLDDFSAFEIMRGPDGSVLPGLRSGRDVLENWLNDFLWMRQELAKGVMTLVVHPHVIGRGHRMIFLETLILKMKEAGALFSTMAEAAERFSPRVDG